MVIVQLFPFPVVEVFVTLLVIVIDPFTTVDVVADTKGSVLVCSR